MPLRLFPHDLSSSIQVISGKNKKRKTSHPVVVHTKNTSLETQPVTKLE